MRVRLLTAALLTGALLCQAVFPQGRGGGLRVAGTDAAGARQEVQLYDGSYALVIGNSEYSLGWDRLGGVKGDVAAVRAVLERHGFKVEVEENLTSERFERRVRKFINDYGYDRDNRLLLYYAGHGYTLNSAGDRRELGYVIPADTPLPSRDERGFRQKAVSMYAIQTYAKEIQAKHALFVFDSCFSGKLFALRDTLKITPFVVEKVAHPVRQFITAGNEAQAVPDESVFRRAFVRGLEGDADRNGDTFITGTELADYLKEAVTNYTDRRQTPQYGTINDIELDRGDFVFVTPNKTSPTPAELAWNKFRGIAKLLVRNDLITGFSEGLAVAKRNGKYGFIDEKDSEVIPFKYDDFQSSCGELTSSTYRDGFTCTGSFSEGLVGVAVNGKWGVIDKTGREVVPLKYDDLVWFSEGVAMVRVGDIKTGKWGFVDKAGKVAIPIKYDEAFPFEDGLTMVSVNGKWGIINKTGQPITPLKYDSLHWFKEGLIAVRWNSKWGFVDKAGREVIPLKYDGPFYYNVNYFSEGLAPVSLNGRWGFVDKTGKEVIGLKYDGASPFSEGLARVKLDGKCGFVDKTGKEVIPLRYDEAGWFENGFATVTLNSKQGLIDKTGREIVPPLKYESVWNIGAKLIVIGVGPYGERKFGLMDRTGREVVPPKYDHIADRLTDGLFVVKMRGKDKYDYTVGLVEDGTGKEIVPPKYSGEIWYWSKDFFGVFLGNRIGFVDVYGNEYFDF